MPASSSHPDGAAVTRAGGIAAAGEHSAVPAQELVPSWAERAIEHSPSVQVSRRRSLDQAGMIVAAGRRLVARKGADFTTRDLTKEARIALQTFYRYFAGKDQLLLAVIEDLLTEAAESLEQAARGIENPVERLRSYVVRTLLNPGEIAAVGSLGAQFMAVERWRLQQAYPQEMDQARRPFIELIRREIESGAAAGQLSSTNPANSAWFVSELITSAHYHHALMPANEPIERVAEELWAFCLAGLRGSGKPDSGQC
jgi:AcrR family transcriptional regulator